MSSVGFSKNICCLDLNCVQKFVEFACLYAFIGFHYSLSNSFKMSIKMDAELFGGSNYRAETRAET